MDFDGLLLLPLSLVEGLASDERDELKDTLLLDHLFCVLLDLHVCWQCFHDDPTQVHNWQQLVMLYDLGSPRRVIIFLG